MAVKALINIFFLCLYMLGFTVCLGRALWAWFEPEFIPPIIRRMPWFNFQGRPNRPLTVVAFIFGALVCLVAIGVRLQLRR